MILVQSIKFNNGSHPINRQKRILPSVKSDSFHRAESKPSFKGLEKEINMHWPVKEFETLFAKTYRAMKKETNFINKIELTSKWENDIDKILKKTTSDGDIKFRFDREHEVLGSMVDLNGHMGYLKKGVIEYKEENYNKYFKYTLKKMLSGIKRYEFFIENGLNENKMNPKDVFKLALDSISEKSKQKRLKVKISGENIFDKCSRGIEYEKDARVTDYQLYTVLSNLLQNSAKYSKENSTILINFKKKNIEGQKYLEFSVTDRGIGIPREEQEKVLQGERASNAIASGIEGTGYGLNRVVKTLEWLNYSYLKIKSPLYPKDKEFPGTKISCFIKLKDDK